MAAIPIGATEVWRLQVYTFGLSQVGINQYDFYVTTTSGTPDAGVVALYFDVTAAPLYKAIMNVDGHYYGTKFFRYAPKPNYAPAYSATVPGPGTLGTAGSMVPSNTCINVVKQLNVWGKGRRGLVKLPFIDKSLTYDNSLTTGGQTLASAIALALIPLGTLMIPAGTDSSVTLEPAVGTLEQIDPMPAPPTRLYNTVVDWLVKVPLGDLRKRGPSGRPNQIPPF